MIAKMSKLLKVPMYKVVGVKKEDILYTVIREFDVVPTKNCPFLHKDSEDVLVNADGSIFYFIDYAKYNKKSIQNINGNHMYSRVQIRKPHWVANVHAIPSKDIRYAKQNVRYFEVELV